MNQVWGKFVDDLVPHRDAGVIEWKGRETIVGVLDRLGREVPGVHFTCLPAGGVIEITGANKGPERGSIQLEVGGGRYVFVCRPLSLICVAFARAPGCCYFDLELAQLHRRDKTPGLRDDAETWHGRIRTVDRSRLGKGMDQNVRKRQADYTRLLRGRLIICSKGTEYGFDEPTCGEMSREQYRKSVQEQVDMFYGPLYSDAYL
jgi:hypothetical protein